MLSALINTIKQSLLAQVLLAATLLLLVLFLAACFVFGGMCGKAVSLKDPEESQKEEKAPRNNKLLFLAALTLAFACATVTVLMVAQLSARKCACLSGNVKKFIDAALASRFSPALRSGFKPAYYSFETENPGQLEPLELKDGNPLELEYVQVKELGKGSFGAVFEAIGKGAQQGKKVAIKMVKNKGAGVDPKPLHFRVGSLEKTFQEEVAAMKKFSGLNGDRFVKFIDAFKDANHFYIVMEHLEGKSLLNLKSQNASEASAIAREILEAVKIMHEHNWRHRDIKPDNIFLTEDGKVKFLDFGISSPIGEGEMMGTPTFTAEEFFPVLRVSEDVALFNPTIKDAPVLLEQEQNAVLRFFRQYQTVDIYGVGATIKALCQDWAQDDAVLKEFLDLAMDVHPWNRPTAASLLKHPFITKYQHVKVSDLKLLP